MVVRTDRSRLELAMRCPRARWYGYHSGPEGRGIQRTRRNVNLLTGSAVHEGLALLPGDVDGAVAHAHGWMQDELANREIELDMNESQGAVFAEQMALTEALIRVFDRVALPKLLEDYEVIESEREECQPLAEGLELMGRVDKVVRAKDSGDLHLWSFKTAASWDQRKDKSAQRDVQGLSEAWLVEQRLQEQVAGVQMIHLMKGRRSEHPKGSGQWVTWNPLIRGYRKHGVVGTEYAHSYDWQDGETGRRLGKGWERFEVWAEYPGGVKQWIEDLAGGLIQPEADPAGLLERQVIMPMPYVRDEGEQASWLTQVRAQETEIAMAVDGVQAMMAEAEPRLAQHSLDSSFPQYRHSCSYPSECQFANICYGSETYRADPLATGDYEARQFNHPIEGEDAE